MASENAWHVSKDPLDHDKEVFVAPEDVPFSDEAGWGDLIDYQLGRGVTNGST